MTVTLEALVVKVAQVAMPRLYRETEALEALVVTVVRAITV